MTIEITSKPGTTILFRSDVDPFNIPWTEWKTVSLSLAMMLEISLLARITSSVTQLGFSFPDGHEVMLWF